jgi:WD40 repeat-containing protein SMU1
MAVTSVSLSKDDSQILSSSLDGTIQVFGIKSGKMLRQFKGHTSYVTNAHYTRDNKLIVSSSSDGTIKVWDSTSAQCLKTFKPGKIESELDIHSLLPLPHLGQHQFIVSNKSNIIYLMNLEGETIKTFTTDQKEKSDFVTARLSPKANFLFAITEDCKMYVFNMNTGEQVQTLQVHEKEVIGLDHHPFRNLLLSFSTDGSLKVWKP